MPRPRIPSTSSSPRPGGAEASSGSSTVSGRRGSRPRKTGRSGWHSSGRSGTSWADTCQERYSHPFRREVDGRVMFFAHNGEIEDFGVRDGNIDSQFIYDRFVESLGTEERPIAEFKQAIAKAKAAIDTEFPRKVESYTFVLIDGNRVIAHRDARTCVPYYTLHETGTDDARVVCSEVLPTLPGRWRMFRNGEFVEIRA